VRRLRPQEHATALAAEQIAAVLPHLPATDPLPWCRCDAGYDPVQLTQALGDTPAAILVRLRSGRCFSADSTVQPHTGRPRRHGHTFVCDAPQTWPTPADDLTVEDTQYGTVRFGLGWTLNFGNPRAILAIIGRLVVPLLLVLGIATLAAPH
jgi:hypothetical protein